ncbi:MAG: non-hydrolyzing UDP-N-acetylglucosamine 2-epimerase, partial [Candidatus Sumerlaeaceae bacterium]
AAIRPHVVIVQGDTTSALCGALAAFYEKIPVAHVEAGLRTNDRYAPFPEEINRRLVAQITTWHFAPTEQACRNLLAEHVAPEHIFVVGNTVVDAVQEIARSAANGSDAQLQYFARRPFVLITHHRRESFGSPIERVFHAIRKIALRHPDVDFIFPVHPNPNVRQHAKNLLAGLENVVLSAPLPYHRFVALMTKALFLITDSGGIQEEATAIGKRVLVTRDTTERPEAIEAGYATLVGTDEERLVKAAEALLTSPESFGPTNKTSPFGDGHASQRILQILSSVLHT